MYVNYKMQHFFLNHIQYFLLSLSLVAGAIVVIPFGTQLYMIGLFYLLCYSFYYRSNDLYLGRYYIIFIITCLISTFVSDSFNYRLFAFIAIIITCTPITISRKLFLFRKIYLKHCLLVFPILSVISLFCYIYGINYCQKEGNVLDFSAIFPHPMWMGAAVGLSNVVIIWSMFTSNKICFRLVYLLILLLSIYITIVSGSRVALFASLVSMILLIIIKLHSIKKIFLAICIISVTTIILLPIYLSGAERMRGKFESSKGKYGSRTEIFERSLKHFNDTPVFGVGFAVSFDELGNKDIGRMESGSGWLSILVQTGIVGFSIIVVILLNLYKVFRYLRCDNELLLFFVAFIYLCLHSIFEGYILTVGYYPCIIFWCLLGYLYTYPYYKNTIYIIEKS